MSDEKVEIPIGLEAVTDPEKIQIDTIFRVEAIEGTRTADVTRVVEAALTTSGFDPIIAKTFRTGSQPFVSPITLPAGTRRLFVKVLQTASANCFTVDQQMSCTKEDAVATEKEMAEISALATLFGIDLDEEELISD